MSDAELVATARQSGRQEERTRIIEALAKHQAAIVAAFQQPDTDYARLLVMCIVTGGPIEVPEPALFVPETVSP